MNIFRLLGDFSHLVAIIILLLKIWKTRSCAGVSGKSVLLYAVVFTCRYLDLFTHFISLYNSVMKIIYLESVAILPQLFMVSKTGEAETITSHYLFALGIYRFLYILNWIYRYYTENFIDWISIVSGIVQTVLYCDFFYLYITKVLKGKKLSLPA